MKTVLIVEDDHLVRKVMEIRLQQMLSSARVLCAIDGSEAERKIKEEKPDVVLLDLILPDKSGFQILEGLQEDIRQKRTAVIIVSNLSSKQDVDRAMELGAKAYFIKSDIDVSQIAEEVKKCL